MPAEPYTDYQEAAQDYLQAFTALRQTPAAPEAAVRAAGDIPAPALIEQAEKIAAISEEMIELSTPYLTSPEAAVREGISNQFVAQAAAELQLATELLEVGEEQSGRPTIRTRAARGSELRDSIKNLEAVMAPPIERSLLSDRRGVRAETVPATREEAVTTLKQTTSTTTSGITARVQELGSSIAMDLFMKSEWTLVAKGASLLRADLFEQLEELKEGASLLIKSAVAAAVKNLLNVYDKILALAGKDIEDKARQRVLEWVEKAKEDGGTSAFKQLVDKFYRVDDLKKDLDGWLEASNADQEQLKKMISDVDALGGKFSTLTKRLAFLETAVVLAKLIKIPQVLLAIAAIQIALLAVVVYAGFDYIGYQEPRFPNLTKGVGEVIREGLSASGGQMAVSENEE